MSSLRLALKLSMEATSSSTTPGKESKEETGKRKRVSETEAIIPAKREKNLTAFDELGELLRDRRKKKKEQQKVLGTESIDTAGNESTVGMNERKSKSKNADAKAGVSTCVDGESIEVTAVSEGNMTPFSDGTGCTEVVGHHDSADDVSIDEEQSGLLTTESVVQDVLNKVLQKAIGEIPEGSNAEKTSNKSQGSSKSKSTVEQRAIAKDKSTDVTVSDHTKSGDAAIGDDNDNDSVSEEQCEKPKKRRLIKQNRQLIEESGILFRFDDEDGPRLSSRAAAQVAKTKLTSQKSSAQVANRDDNPPPLKRQASKTAEMKLEAKVEKAEAKAARSDSKASKVEEDEEEEEVKAEWVQCDQCGKWRRLPLAINPDALPDRWDCSMITWMSVAPTCESPEETATADKKGDGGDSNLEVVRSTSVKRQKTNNSAKKAVGPKAAAALVETTTKSPMIEEDEAFVRKRVKAPVVPPPPMPAAKLETTLVDWVECSSCRKWRKVPSAILESLPDVWMCSQNTWAPAYSKCSVPQEEDDKPLQVEDAPVVAAAVVPNRRGRPVSTTNTATEVVKKVTQWVQCERKNCGKWRKVPPNVDLSSLADNWFCERNFWDPERRTCDAVEESDSETENPQATNARTQLILANSKGPGQLSYRRIIFGPDGRLKPHYSEKNKVGYGIFSYTEPARYNADSDEHVPPVKKISYWSSGCYDESGAQFSTGLKRRRFSPSVLSRRLEEERSSHQGGGHQGVQEEVTEKAPEHRATHLLDAARRMQGWPTAPGPTRLHSKRLRQYEGMKLQEKLAREGSVVRSCALNFVDCTETPVLFTALEEAIASSRFVDEATDLCRQLFTFETLKDTVRRLEIGGELEVTENLAGERSIRMIVPSGKQPPTGDVKLDASATELGRLPLKMRKSKFFAPEPEMIVLEAI